VWRAAFAAARTAPLSVIGSTTVTAAGAIRFEAKDPVSLAVASASGDLRTMATKNQEVFSPKSSISAWRSLKCR